MCLSSTLRSFVLFRAPLEGLIAAHTRSPFVSSFCHLFSMSPFLSLSLGPGLAFFSRPRCIPTPTTTPDREEGLSHTLLFAFLYSPTCIYIACALLLFLFRSLSRRSRLPSERKATRTTCHSVVPFSFPRGNDRFLRRVLFSSSVSLVLLRSDRVTLLSSSRPGAISRKRERERRNKAAEKRAKERFNASTPR